MAPKSITMEYETLRLNSDHLSLRAIGPWLVDLAGRFDLQPDDIELDAVELAVHEVAMNIVDHSVGIGGGEFSITGECDELALRVRTFDAGEAFARSNYSRPKFDEPQVRGYGLFIAEQIADSVRYDRVGDQNQWELVFSFRSVRS